MHFIKESKVPNETVIKSGDIICKMTIGFVCITQRRKRYVIMLQSIASVWHLSFHFIFMFQIAIFSNVVFYFYP